MPPFVLIDCFSFSNVVLVELPVSSSLPAPSAMKIASGGRLAIVHL